ncbi:hypothetical protein [Actinomadura pelletieri]|uniref:hypothetical protein n=1 Tax=Actinomadura pelletieri TaxID=111805 RepID=UPI0011C43DCB|nr:hypothetical protein [Actinomadura pelletieri]
MSVRQSCIEEYGPEGVGSVEPVQPSGDETGEAPGVPPTEEQTRQCIEQARDPEGCREKIDPQDSEDPSESPTGPDDRESG